MFETRVSAFFFNVLSLITDHRLVASLSNCNVFFMVVLDCQNMMYFDVAFALAVHCQRVPIFHGHLLITDAQRNKNPVCPEIRSGVILVRLHFL